jgi:hypothetical protein
MQNPYLLNPKKIKEPELFVTYQTTPNAACFEGIKLLEKEIIEENFSIMRSRDNVIGLQNARQDPEQNIHTKLKKWFINDQDYALVLEDFPVFLPEDAEHWVIWINPKIQDSKDAENLVNKLLIGLNIDPTNYIIWHRKARNGTAPMAIHYHLYIKKGLIPLKPTSI